MVSTGGVRLTRCDRQEVTSRHPDLADALRPEAKHARRPIALLDDPQLSGPLCVKAGRPQLK